MRDALQAELEDATEPGWAKVPEKREEATLFQPEAGPALTEYRRRLAARADWGDQRIWHRAGFLPWVHGAMTDRLGVQIFRPTGPSRGTLLFVHGYLAHAGDFAYTFSRFNALGWTIVTLDLPGHGLSTGVRADILNFEDYGDAVATWLDWYRSLGWPGSPVLVAHSLGTAASLEALSRPGAWIPDQVIFVAPLLRPVGYTWLLVGEHVVGWALKEVPSQLGGDGYLDGTAATVHWFTALRKWLGRLDDRQPVSLPLIIVSGDQDQVVDQSWNQAQYQRLVPGHRYVLLPGKDHLLLTNLADREMVHAQLIALLSSPN